MHPPQASPHLLASEVLYRFSSTAYDEWNLESVGGGTIACGIDQMASSFLAQLTQRESIPHISMLISYLSITHGGGLGLGLMDAKSRAIPDFVLTMAQATRYAKFGIKFDDGGSNLHFPTSLGDIFRRSVNSTSTFLLKT